MNEFSEDMNQETTPSVTDAPEKEVFNLKKEVFEWIYTILVALVIAFVIKGFIFDVVKVDGNSMFPTLMNNDRLIITKLGYEPKQQDIVILDSNYKKREAYYAQSGKDLNAFSKLVDYYFNLPNDLKKRFYVKRIIALGGQTVDIIDGKVWVDGKELEEEYYQGDTPLFDATIQFPLTVEEDCVFVMGDNRPHSSDSRSSNLGTVPLDAILGKAQLRIWPLNTIGITD